MFSLFGIYPEISMESRRVWRIAYEIICAHPRIPWIRAEVWKGIWTGHEWVSRGPPGSRSLLRNYHFRCAQGRLAANQESGNRLGNAANISTEISNGGSVSMPSSLIKRDARRRDAVFASVEAGERCRNSESESIVPKDQLFYYSYLLLRIRRFAIFFWINHSDVSGNVCEYIGKGTLFFIIAERSVNYSEKIPDALDFQFFILMRS